MVEQLIFEFEGHKQHLYRLYSDVPEGWKVSYKRDGKRKYTLLYLEKKAWNMTTNKKVKYLKKSVKKYVLRQLDLFGSNDKVDFDNKNFVFAY